MIEREDPVNWSTLRSILTSPKHYRHALSHPREDTEALRLGRMIHSLVYEPDTVSKYAVMPRFHAGMNDDTAIAKGYAGGKQAKAEWEADHQGCEVIEADLYARAMGMREALMADECARAMIEGGLAEQQIEWHDALTGIKCRGRVDHINGRLSDLKSTADIMAFDRSVARYKYHGQMAFYSDGLEANGFDFFAPPVFIVVESQAPFDVAVRVIGDDTLAAGRAMYRRALDTLLECRKLDRWPGVAGGEIQRVCLPAWAQEADDVEITIGGEAAF